MISSRHEIRFTAVADRDFLEIMDWSAVHFGAAAADRYEALIGQALIDLAEIRSAQDLGGVPSCLLAYIRITSPPAATGCSANW